MRNSVHCLALVLSAATACFAAADGAGQGGDPAVDGLHPQRAISAIRADVSAALRAEALARRSAGHTSEVLRLIELYHELAAHPRRHDSAILAQLAQQLRSRLMRVRDSIVRQRPDQVRGAERQEVELAGHMPEGHVLAQFMPPGGGGAPGAPPGGPPAIDYGPDLVELIQRTISPATWDINGGPGAVVYYAPLRVLVVRAPSQVHEQVGGVVGQLRGGP